MESAGEPTSGRAIKLLLPRPKLLLSRLQYQNRLLESSFMTLQRSKRRIRGGVMNPGVSGGTAKKQHPRKEPVLAGVLAAYQG